MTKLLQDIFDSITPARLLHYREFYDRMERELPFDEFTARLHAEVLQTGIGLEGLLQKHI